MITVRTNRIRRYSVVDGYMVQFIVDDTFAPYIDDFLSKQVNGELEITIKKPTKKRSVNANAYLWTLCDEIAKAVGTDKEDIYKALIRRVGVFDYVIVKSQVADRFRRNWESKGVGWFCEDVFFPDKDKRQLIAYYGTSVYDTDQMSRVIDEAVEEARSNGVKTLTRKELNEIKEKWTRTDSSNYTDR